jgi:hypothetical protein
VSDQPFHGSKGIELDFSSLTALASSRDDRFRVPRPKVAVIYRIFDDKEVSLLWQELIDAEGRQCHTRRRNGSIVHCQALCRQKLWVGFADLHRIAE